MIALFIKNLSSRYLKDIRIIDFGTSWDFARGPVSFVDLCKMELLNFKISFPIVLGKERDDRISELTNMKEINWNLQTAKYREL